MRIAIGLTAWAVVLAGLGWLGWVFEGIWSFEAGAYYSHGRVTLPGSHMIRLPTTQSQPLELLSKVVRAHCSTFVTLPGMNSLYFWTEESPPTWFNATTWSYLLDSSQQEQVVHRIEGKARSRFCVIDNPANLSFWAQSPPPQRPLLRLVQQFERDNGPPKLFGGYRLFVSSGASHEGDTHT